MRWPVLEYEEQRAYHYIWVHSTEYMQIKKVVARQIDLCWAVPGPVSGRLFLDPQMLLMYPGYREFLPNLTGKSYFVKLFAHTGELAAILL